MSYVSSEKKKWNNRFDSVKYVVNIDRKDRYFRNKKYIDGPAIKPQIPTTTKNAMES